LGPAMSRKEVNCENTTVCSGCSPARRVIENKHWNRVRA
jgi:hypothetical protein